MKRRFDQQVIVVTGGSSGIGLAIARAAINEGARRVYITGRSRETLDSALEMLGERAIALVSDVSRSSDLARLRAEIEKQGYSLDAVFANAGIAASNTLGATSEEQYDELFGINVKGVLLTVQTLLPLMVDGSSLVLTSSIVSGKGMENLSLYSASKAAVRSFARSWANDLKGRGIRVNALSPGFTRTPIMKNGLKWNDEQIAAFDEQAKTLVPLGHVATPESIASAALFLASGDADYVNGVELAVDGGFSQI